MQTQPSAPSQRLASIDAFRGFAIIAMVLANYLGGVRVAPAWLKHAPDIGLTVIDLIAPFFIFSIGLTYAGSLQRRAGREGWPRAYGHALTRYLSILGIGALLSAGQIALGIEGETVNWGVLQAIGVAGLLALLTVRLPGWARVGLALAVLAGYQALLDAGWKALVLASPHGGLLGAVSWTAMLLLAAVLGEQFLCPPGEWTARIGRLVGGSAAALAGGLLLALWFPISKNRVSPPYILVSLGASGLLFGLFSLFFDRLRDRLHLRAGWLQAWGMNPLALYVLHLLLLGLFALPAVPAWYAEAPAWLAALQAALLLVLLSLAARGMERRGTILTI